MARDFYEVLGVDRSASRDDIKRAYRNMSKKWHPDKHKGDKEAEQRFKEVNEAYEALSDEDKRKRYDQFGAAGVNGGGQGFGGFDFSGFNGAGGFEFNLGDIFENFFTGGAGGRRRPTDQRGEHRHIELTIDFSETVNGAEKTISFENLVQCETCGGNGAAKGSTLTTCKDCGGTGQQVKKAQSFFGVIQQAVLCATCRGSGKIPEKSCPTCDGEGRVQKKVTITIAIPAGIHDGQSLTVRGRGDAGRQGAAAGDLVVHIRVRADDRFERDGDDVRSAISIPVFDAALGTSMDIPTVDGSVSLKIPAGTQSGQVFRLKGKGMPVLNSSRRGDHYVIVTVEIPKKLSRKEKELIEKWKEIA
jgi:molecular chaperone DnaJ